MYPTTKFDIIDNSAITSLPITSTGTYKVLEMCGFSSDRGPEEYKVVEGEEFFKLYGSSISFEKHGQPLLQAAMAINAGARLYCKRIVAEDSVLANVGVVAVLETVAAGTGNLTEDTIVLHYEYLSINSASGEDTYGYTSANRKANPMTQLKKDFIKAATTTLLQSDEDDGFTTEYYANAISGDPTTGYTLNYDRVYFPLFVVAENGRGSSSKSFKIIPDYSGSKYYQFTKYQFEIQENSTTLETVNFALPPDTSYDGANLSIEAAFRSSNQLRVRQYADKINEFISTLATLLGITVSELSQHDILCLKNNKKKALTPASDAYTDIIYVDSSSNSDVVSVVYADLAVTATNTSSSVATTVLGTIPTSDSDSTYISVSATSTTDVTSIDATISVSTDDGDYVNTVTLNSDNGFASTISNVDSTYISGKTFGISYTVTTADATYTSVAGVYDSAVDLANTVIELDCADITDTAKFTVVTTGDTEDEGEDATSTTVEYVDITSHQYMMNGSNGSFGSKPIEADSYNKRMADVFNGTYSNDIYDLDNIKIDVIVDANYSHGAANDEAMENADSDNNYTADDVKTAIQEFVSFREDCLYFADMGTGMYTLEQIKRKFDLYNHDKFTAIYHNSYNIIDPYSYKEITVTIGYHIAQLLVNHFATGRVRPFAGMLYGITLDDVIDGTINYVATNTPAGDEKEELDDLRVNYASYYDGVLVIETLYTSQENYTQFSFLNNILVIQNLIKDIRTECPKIRYSFLDGDDLTYYKNQVQKVIDNHAPSFLEITFEYVEDETYAQNKIFYGAIEVKFKNFVQSELFKVTAIG